MSGLSRARLLRGLVALALVTLAAVGLRLSEGVVERDAEVVRGVLGEPVAISGGTVTADRVRVGTTLLRFERVEATTAGLFLAVRVEVAATGTTSTPGYQSTLVSGDRRYANTSTLGLAVVEPGFAEVRDVVFEVDPARIDDLTLELTPGGFLSGYSEHARIHLGITPDNAEEWRTAGRDQSIEPAADSRRGL